MEVGSREDDCNLFDSDLWVDTEKDIPDFNFESTISRIKINVLESARYAPIDLFKLYARGWRHFSYNCEFHK